MARKMFVCIVGSTNGYMYPDLLSGLCKLPELANVSNYHNHLWHVHRCEDHWFRVTYADLGKRQSVAVVMRQTKLERNISRQN